MSRSALVNKTDWGNAVDDQIFSTNLDDLNILSVVNVETQEQGRFADVMGVAAPGTTLVESRSWMMSLANIRPKKGTGLALPKQPLTMAQRTVRHGGIVALSPYYVPQAAPEPSSLPLAPLGPAALPRRHFIRRRRRCICLRGGRDNLAPICLKWVGGGLKYPVNLRSTVVQQLIAVAHVDQDRDSETGSKPVSVRRVGCNTMLVRSIALRAKPVSYFNQEGE